MAGITYALEIDWDNDDTYSNAYADVWSDVIDGSFSCERGRNFASYRDGRSMPGRLRCRMWNNNELYTPTNDQSPLHGLLHGGRRIRWKMADDTGTLVTQWTGWVDEIVNHENDIDSDYVEISALGALSRIDWPVTVALQTDITTADAAKLLFDPDDSLTPDTDYVINGVDYNSSHFTGTREMPYWWVGNELVRAALTDLELTEGGFVYERKDGFIAMDEWDWRITAAASVGTFTTMVQGIDEIPLSLNGYRPDQPLRELANRFTSTVRQFADGTEKTLWSGIGIVVPGGSGVTLRIEFPTRIAENNEVAVDDWVDPVSGTDYTAQTGLTVAFTGEGNSGELVLSNSNRGDITVDINIRGTPLLENDSFVIVTEDDDSIAEYGLREYISPAKWLGDIDEVEELQDFQLTIYKDPAERVDAEWDAYYNRRLAADLDLSDRCQVIHDEMAHEYFVESIRHEVSGINHQVTMKLSPTAGYGTVIILDIGPGLGTGVLGRSS